MSKLNNLTKSRLPATNYTKVYLNTTILSRHFILINELNKNFFKG